MGVAATAAVWRCARHSRKLRPDARSHQLAAGAQPQERLTHEHRIHHHPRYRHCRCRGCGRLAVAQEEGQSGITAGAGNTAQRGPGIKAPDGRRLCRLVLRGWLAGIPIKPYELPAHIKGYGANGAYDRDKYDPRFYDALAQRIVAADGTFVDIATLTRVFPDGTSDKIAPTTMRQWLYGLSIDPASAASMGLLAQAMIDAPRSLGQRSPGAGQGDFGGGS